MKATQVMIDAACELASNQSRDEVVQMVQAALDARDCTDGNEPMSWFGAYAGGALLATMVTLFAGFIWWSLALLMETSPPDYMSAVLVGLFAVLWVSITAVLWRNK